MTQDAKAAKHWPLFSSLALWQPAFLPADLIAGLTLAAIARVVDIVATVARVGRVKTPKQQRLRSKNNG